MIGALVVASFTMAQDRIPGVGFGAIVVLGLTVVAEIVEFDIPIDDQPLGRILQPRYPQAEVPLRIGDRQLLASLVFAEFGDVFPGEGIPVVAPERSEQLERSAPPGTPAVGAAFIGFRGRDIQDAREFALVLHWPEIRLATRAQ